jgi:hypothetical protein
MPTRERDAMHAAAIYCSRSDAAPSVPKYGVLSKASWRGDDFAGRCNRISCVLTRVGSVAVGRSSSRRIQDG